MRQVLDHIDILITAPFFFGYIWAADKFCKKFLGASKKKELLFIVCIFFSYLFMDIAGRRYSILYIFSLLLNPIFFMGLVILLFQSDKEKRILVAAMLMMGIRLVGNFCNSFLSLLVLIFRHTVKKISDPLLAGWETGLIDCIRYCSVIFVICWMSKHLAPVFCDKPRKWYALLAIPLFVIITVFDVASWGGE